MIICACHNWAREFKLTDDGKFHFHHPKCELFKKDDLVTKEEYGERLKNPLDVFWRSQDIAADIIRPEMILAAVDGLARNSNQHLNALTPAENTFLSKLFDYVDIKIGAGS